MTVITLSNANRSIDLDFVVTYRISKRTQHPIKKIPNKQLPTIDPDAKTTGPREYDVTAYITNVTRGELISLEGDREVIRIQNGVIDDPCTFLDQGPTFDYRMGSEDDRPWRVALKLLSSAN